jgi:tetratricopeptide (TPR) repeat protein
MIYQSDGRLREAASHYHQALQMYEDNPDARYALLQLNLGIMLGAIDGERSRMVESMLIDTWRLDQGKLFTPQLFFIEGVLAANRGEYVLSESKFIEAMKQDDTYVNALLNLAGLYMTYLNRPEEARRLYGKALTLDLSDEERNAIVDTLSVTDNRL